MKDQNNRSSWVVVGCVSAAVAVACGAIGAHLLEGWLSENFDDAPKRIENWKTASNYHLVHSVGLILAGQCAWLTASRRRIVGMVLVTGILLFSFGLYGFVVTDFKPLVAAVPVGGLSYIAGWLLFAWFACSCNDKSENELIELNRSGDK